MWEKITILEFVCLPLAKPGHLEQSGNAALDLGLWGYKMHLYVVIRRRIFREGSGNTIQKIRDMEMHHLYSKNSWWIG